jgi:hypothetical protein
MRTARFSITANDQLNTLLAQGLTHYSADFVEQKRALVYDAIRRFIVPFPATRLRDPDLGLRCYPVAKTPFVLVYDFDDAEVRIHFVVHKSADRSRIDPTSSCW